MPRGAAAHLLSLTRESRSCSIFSIITRSLWFLCSVSTMNCSRSTPVESVYVSVLESGRQTRVTRNSPQTPSPTPFPPAADSNFAGVPQKCPSRQLRVRRAAQTGQTSALVATNSACQELPDKYLPPKGCPPQFWS